MLFKTFLGTPSIMLATDFNIPDVCSNKTKVCLATSLLVGFLLEEYLSASFFSWSAELAS